MPTPLTAAEQETHLSLVADDRNIWFVESNDPVMMRRLESIGAIFVREMFGGGREYTLRADQVLLRKGKAKRGPLSDAQRAALQRNAFGSKPSVNDARADTRNDE